MFRAIGTAEKLRVVTACLLFWLVGILSAGAFDSSQRIITVIPTEIEAPLANPYMGWGLWAGLRYFDGRSFTLEYNTTGFGDDAPLFRWVLIDWMWSDLEPQEGQYYWKDLDTIINYWAERGKQFYLRVWVTDDPGWNGAPGNEVCPAWLWADGAKYHEYIGEGNSKKREPDYADASYEKVYLPRLRRLLMALARRYDRPESPVIMWGVMGYGQWGEWHTNWSHYPWPSVAVKHRVLAEVVEAYADAFRVKLPCICYSLDMDPNMITSLEDVMYRQALDVAVSRGFALAKHSFMDGLDLWHRAIMEKYWRQSPMFAEDSWSYTELKDQRTHGTLDENIDAMLDWHSNFGHFYMDAESYRRAMREDRSSFERGLRSGGLGYRLVLRRASWKEELPAGSLFVLKQYWVNRNGGRLYVRHPLKVYLTDVQGNDKFSEVDRGYDETHWVEGETYTVNSVFHLPKDLASGTYDIRIARVDARGKPGIKLGMQGEDAKGRYRLGTIRITFPQAEVPCDQPRCP
jgi:hypothetical protein